MQRPNGAFDILSFVAISFAVFLLFVKGGECLTCRCNHFVFSGCDAVSGSGSCVDLEYGGHAPTSHTPNYTCFYLVEADSDGSIFYNWGCYDLNSRRLSHSPCKDKEKFKREICCFRNECNAFTEKDLPWPANWTVTTAKPSAAKDDNFIPALVGGIVAAAIIVTFLSVVGCVWYSRHKQAKMEAARLANKPENGHLRLDDGGLPSYAKAVGWEDSISSGKGAKELEQRTIAREVTLLGCIGNGRFGEVRCGEWRGRKVAVKIFRTIEETSFFREVELYNTLMIRHENILGFVAGDNIDVEQETQLWMVLDYHPNGSLFDYLQRESVNPDRPLTIEAVHLLASSAVAGLAHLHMHIGGQRGGQPLGHKPSIAHRDLKSKNILVKENLTCCIADLGMAIRNDPESGEIQHFDPKNVKVGTRRYMAPEVLDDSINIGLFESFRQVDMYALAMVLWEIMWCCQVDGHANAYTQPFHNMVPHDPSVENMYHLVCVVNGRPPIPDFWDDYEVLQGIGDIITTCWRGNPSSRLTAANVKKRLSQLGGSIKYRL